jgi:hypothetical protein
LAFLLSSYYVEKATPRCPRGPVFNNTPRTGDFGVALSYFFFSFVFYTTCDKSTHFLFEALFAVVEIESQNGV